jgi:hypothetical protein
MAQLQNELAERELIKKFRHENSWVSDLVPKNSWVNNDVIKIPRQGAAPEVLINNGVYPIQSNNRDDDFITLSLNKYDTENTTVSDDELYALPYEKVNDVQVQHRESLEDVTAEHALHSIAVPAASATTPVLVTTGANDGTGRKRLTTADLITLWKQLADLNVPLADRIIVLSTEHAADLMLEDSDRNKSWGSDWSSGKVPVYHVGFKLWTVSYSPRYNLVSTVWTKQGFGSALGRPASIVYYKKHACKATGTVKRYARLADQDPENRRNTIGFRLWFIAIGIKSEGFAAIVSATV